jgi:two-component system, NarL family, sensor histidine kinase UhpB
MELVRRIATGLRPAVLDDLGLIAALEWQLAQFATLSGLRLHSTLPATDPPLHADACTAVFRIVQEALTNIARHAQATEVSVRMESDTHEVRVEVADDGRGITQHEQASPDALGLVGLRERALAAGGALTITGAPGRGTRVSLRLPVPPAAT